MDTPASPFSSTPPIKDTFKQQRTGQPGQSLGVGIIAGAQTDRFLIQDFRPLADSIEWALGQNYLRQRGSQAFLGDPHPVPFVINNDGVHSRLAADVLVASLVEGETPGNSSPPIVGLELGIGVGLFARYVLDAMQDWCLENGKDYYDRFLYIAADRSQAMLRDASRQGIFANHPGRYLLRVIDALQPEKGLLPDVALKGQGGRPLHGVFLNYLLDCLPAAVIEVDGEQVRQLCVRTWLARGADLRRYTDAGPEELARMAGSADGRDHAELLKVYELFSSEYDYLPADIGQIPYGEFAVQQAREHGGRLLHSYGAIQCLERLWDLLQDGGFILMNDYGQTQPGPDDEFEHQRFSQATFMGVNFALLKAYFAGRPGCQWVEPAEDSPHIYSRLLGRNLAPTAAERFRELFGKTAADWRQQPVQRARALAQAGRLDAAASSYRQALERQPNNWVLMHEIALFLTHHQANPKAGLELTKVALDLNPTCSADLWSTLGDALYELGRVEESRRAYLKALQINENDVRARYNLAWAHARQQDYGAALQRIGEALVHDADEVYRDRLLQKQAEVLAALSHQHQQKRLRLANRVNPLGSRPGPPTPAGDGKAHESKKSS